MPYSKTDEDMVSAFFAQFGLTPLRYTPEEMRALGQTPDFRVFKGSSPSFFCEVKSLEDDKSEGLRSDPTYNKISHKIHEAVKQFDSVNPDRNFPNILAFSNHDTSIDILDLKAVVDGYLYTENSAYPIFKKFSDGQIRDEKYRVDLFLWFALAQKPYWLFKEESPFIDLLVDLFSIDRSQLART